ncbi:PepSY domain-containing protein [Isoptericola sp. BMS4]|uniref:PepSY domain-containing protein n=1 Tax=Isoptericola sp. BMS4 TaxID=2527875 RepID=UPI0014220D3E|nr:PepSY domain-containing protein [Isoptericola sp. BMS4]
MRSSRRRFALPTTALAVTLALAACGGDDPADRADAPEATDAGTAPEDGEPDGDGQDDATGANGVVTVPGLHAVETALEEVDGVAFAISRSGDYSTWDVDVATGDGAVEVSLDATGSTVRGTDTEEDLAPELRKAVEDAPVSLAEAIDVAIAEVPGDLDEAELDDETTGYLWTVAIDDGSGVVDVDVARTSGAVVGITERSGN